MIIALGSTSNIKVNAMRVAIDRFRGKPLSACAYNVKSGVPEQPIGLEGGRAGAVARARGALAANRGAEYGLGVENTVVQISYGGWVDLAVVAIIRRGHDAATFTTSVGIPISDKDVAAAIASGQAKTAGSFIAMRTGCDAANWHKHATGDLLDRETILADAIYAAFCIEWAQPQKR